MCFRGDLLRCIIFALLICILRSTVVVVAVMIGLEVTRLVCFRHCLGPLLHSFCSDDFHAFTLYTLSIHTSCSQYFFSFLFSSFTNSGSSLFFALVGGSQALLCISFMIPSPIEGNTCSSGRAGERLYHMQRISILWTTLFDIFSLCADIDLYLSLLLGLQVC